MHARALPAFDDNYVWALVDDRGRAVIVDPGDAAPVLAAADAGMEPLAVLITHHHADHIGGLPDLLARWPALPVWGPEDARIAHVTTRVRDGDAVQIGGRRWQVVAVPGHTRSHIAWFSGETHGGGLLCCGDTLFSLGCGRLFEGTPAQMLTSLDRLAALPPATRVLCAHEYTLANGAFAQVVDAGNPALQARIAQARAQRQRGEPTVPSTLGEELACNPFLRVDAPAVREAVAGWLGHAPADRVACFAGLRAWKDGFRG